MKWFSNMRLKNKLRFGFFLLFAITMTGSLFGLMQLHNLAFTFEMVRNYPDQRQIILRDFELSVAQGQIADLMGLSSYDYEREALLLIEEYRANIRSDIFAEEFMQDVRITSAINRTDELLAHARNFFSTGLLTELEAINDGITYLYIFENEYILLLEGAVNAIPSQINVISAIVIIVSFLFCIVIIMIISNPISRQTNMAADALKAVAVGNLNVNINKTNLAKDEVGKLTGDVYGLIEVIKSMVSDLNNTHTQYIEVGNINYQIDDTKYQNTYKDMMSSINKILSSVTKEITEIGGVMDKLSGGDFNVEIDPTAWVGDWAVLPQSAHNLSAGLTSVSSEINAMIKSVATKGDLSYKTNEAHYKGDWQKIMTGLNDITKAVDTPLSEINSVMEKLSQGEFGTVVSGNYAGVFLNSKESVNTTIQTLSEYIEEIKRSLSRVAEGDLTVEITRFYVGDFYALKESINTISNTLNKTMTGISNAADQVLAGANQISNSAADLSNGAREQSSSVQELNASIEMISNQTRRNADNALTANDLSTKSTENAGEGANAMKQMVEAMGQIKESSNNISHIVKTVQDIAFQTNLLALNASVEAARAGEHGKGFAVVADEVRTLAGRSQVAATETTSLITDSISRVDSGAIIAETTAESLNAIVESASEVLEVISSISTASKEQAEAIEQISGGIAQISNVTQTNTAVSEETAAASEELNAQAETLRQLVSYFKL